jgi:hypothetical protein
MGLQPYPPRAEAHPRYSFELDCKTKRPSYSGVLFLFSSHLHWRAAQVLRGAFVATKQSPTSYLYSQFKRLLHLRSPALVPGASVVSITLRSARIHKPAMPFSSTRHSGSSQTRQPCESRDDRESTPRSGYVQLLYRLRV